MGLLKSKPKRGQYHRIIVMSDGETWEVLNSGQDILWITEEAFQKLELGEHPKNLRWGFDIRNSVGLKRLLRMWTSIKQTILKVQE